MSYEKKSFQIKLKDERGKKLNVDMFGIRKDDTWILDAMAIDRMRMRNILCFTVWNEMSKLPYETKLESRNGIKGTYVELCLNGKYHGLFCLEDKVNKKLLGVKNTKEKKGTLNYGGAIYKCKNFKGGHNLVSDVKDDPTNSITWNAWELKEPEDYPCQEVWTPLINFIEFCSDETDDKFFLQHYQDYFYVDNFLDYLIFINALGITDNKYKNTYLSIVDINKGKQLVITPWDLDSSLGRWYNGVLNPTLYLISSMQNDAPVRRLYKYNADGFVKRMIARWNELAESILSPEHVRRLMEERAAKLMPSGAWQRERAKWNGNPIELPQSPQEEIDYVMSWYEKNFNAIKEDMKKVELNVHGVQTSENITNDHAIYDLAGRRVSKPLKGIYIKRGKKYIVN